MLPLLDILDAHDFNVINYLEISVTLSSRATLLSSFPPFISLLNWWFSSTWRSLNPSEDPLEFSNSIVIHVALLRCKKGEQKTDVQTLMFQKTVWKKLYLKSHLCLQSDILQWAWVVRRKRTRQALSVEQSVTGILCHKGLETQSFLVSLKGKMPKF